MDFGRNIASWPFRRKLLIFLLVIFLPFFGIIAADGFRNRQRAITEAQEDALLLVRSLAAQQEQIAIATKTMLSTLAQLSEVQNLDTPACNRIFHELHQRYPFYASILAMNRDGYVFAAHSRLEPGKVNQSDRKYFQDAVNSLDFSAGEYIIGRVSKTTSLNYSFPVLDANQKLVAILTAGLNLHKFSHFISRAKLTEGSAVVFMDHQGVRVYRSPENKAMPIGRPVLQGFFARISGPTEEGVFDWTSLDGVERIFAFKQLRLRENLSPYLYVAVGLPKGLILQKANLNMLRNLGILGITASLGLYLAWALGNLVIIRPINQLVAAAQRFGSGKMDTRTGLPHTTDELGRLARSFDGMASLLEMRNRQREKAEQGLSQAYEELEQRVRERTAELVRANELLNQEVIERKQVAKVLTESEEKYRLLVSNIPAIVCKGYWNWEIDFFDDKIEELLGYSKEEFNSRRLKWKDIIIEEDLPNIQRILLEALQTYRYYIREYRVKTKEARIIWLQERSQIICTPDGKVDYISAVFFDITERRRAEDDLREAHAEIEQLFASITSILIGLTPEGSVWHWNAEAEKILGLTAGEAMGQRLDKLPITWDGSRISEALAQCRKHFAAIRLENVRFQRREGKNGFLGITINPITGKDGETSGFILLGSDVTERLILENQLAQAQKLESIGQLAAGIAHEINTPIQYVGDNTRFLRDAFGDLLVLTAEHGKLLAAVQGGGETQEIIKALAQVEDQVDPGYLADEIPKAIGQSLEGLERVGKIVRAMKEFSHPGTGEKTAVDINKAIESTITVARNEWKYVAEMVTDLDPGLPLIPCLPDEFNQVLLNLIINSAHAIGEVVAGGEQAKGTITISTRQDGDWVEIRLQDTGTGIPEEVRSKIFDPFFTTKEVGKGTGQGLAIARSVIVDKHEGTITFETEMGKGTTFIIRLPRGHLGS